MKSLSHLTFLMSGLSLLLGVGIVMALITPVKQIGGGVSEKVPARNNFSANLLVGGSEKKVSFDDYEDVFSKDVFDSSLAQPVTTKANTAAVTGDGSFNPEEYKVVGILIDQKPEAVLEYKKDKATYFLSVGDELNGAVVADITPSLVVLEAAEGRVELIPDGN